VAEPEESENERRLVISADSGMTRRTVLRGAAGAAAAGMLGGLAPGIAGAARTPLWRTAERRGVVFGTSMSTRLVTDARYLDLVNREAALLFTEDDLLWYQLKPSRDAPLNFAPGDQIVALAEQQKQLLFGAHLVWDEGFGEGWGEDEMFKLSEQEARDLLFGTVEAVVKRYKGRVAGWIVVNEAISNEGKNGLRTDVPWYQTIGPSYVAESFRLVHAADPTTCSCSTSSGSRP
jgi:endo-1,4-beta-xylanase